MYLKRNLERKGIFTNIQLHLFPQLWGGHGNPFQYSCLENRMDREAWQATVHRATQSWTWLKQLSRNASIVSGLKSFYLSKTIYSKAEQSTQHSLADCYIWTYPHFLAKIRCGMGDPRGHSGKEPTCWWTQAPSPGWDNPQPTPVFLPEKFHGQGSLLGYSPRGRTELDVTEQLSAEHCIHVTVALIKCFCMF